MDKSLFCCLSLAPPCRHVVPVLLRGGLCLSGSCSTASAIGGQQRCPSFLGRRVLLKFAANEFSQSVVPVTSLLSGRDSTTVYLGPSSEKARKWQDSSPIGDDAFFPRPQTYSKYPPRAATVILPDGTKIEISDTEFGSPQAELNVHILQYGREGKAMLLEKLIMDNYEIMNRVNISCALSQVSRLVGEGRYSFTEAKTKVCPLLKRMFLEYDATFRLRELSQFAHACAKLGYKDADVLDRVALRGSHLCVHDDLMAFTKLVYSLAKLQHKSRAIEQFFDEASESLQAVAFELNEQEVSNIVWAYAKLKVKASGLFEIVEARALELLDQFSPQGLANLVWSYAAMGYQNHLPLFRAIAARAQVILAQFRPGELSMLCWSFGKLHYRDDQLMEAIARASVPRMASLQPQGVSNLLWAFACLQYFDSALLESATDQLRTRAGQFKPQELASCVWALSVANRRDLIPIALDGIATVAGRSQLRSSEVSQIAIAWNMLQDPGSGHDPQRRAEDGEASQTVPEENAGGRVQRKAQVQEKVQVNVQKGEGSTTGVLTTVVKHGAGYRLPATLAALIKEHEKQQGAARDAPRTNKVFTSLREVLMRVKPGFVERFRFGEFIVDFAYPDESLYIDVLTMDRLLRVAGGTSEAEAEAATAAGHVQGAGGDGVDPPNPTVTPTRSPMLDGASALKERLIRSSGARYVYFPYGDWDREIKQGGTPEGIVRRNLAL